MTQALQVLKRKGSTLNTAILRQVLTTTPKDTLMLILLLATFVMALTYGALWHNESARHQNPDRSGSQNAAEDKPGQ